MATPPQAHAIPPATVLTLEHTFKVGDPWSATLGNAFKGYSVPPAPTHGRPGLTPVKSILPRTSGIDNRDPRNLCIDLVATTRRFPGHDLASHKIKNVCDASSGPSVLFRQPAQGERPDFSDSAIAAAELPLEQDFLVILAVPDKTTPAVLFDRKLRIRGHGLPH